MARHGPGRADASLWLRLHAPRAWPGRRRPSSLAQCEVGNLSPVSDAVDTTEADGVERSRGCAGPPEPTVRGSRPGSGHRLRVGAGAPGVERVEVSLVGTAFSPHRHDTYAVGITLAGVQTFRYRGEQRYCLPGQWHVLHPDEPHDGAAGTEDGFGYRIIYLDPLLVHLALDGGGLPFVADPIVQPRRIPASLHDFLVRIDEPLDDLRATEVTALTADMLRANSRTPVPRRPSPVNVGALHRVREVLIENPAERHSARELETVAGMDRWSIARQFRAVFGTSPSRFRTMRQLDLARTLIRGGQRLADVAQTAGFSDQAHLTRVFKRGYGMTPAVWAAAVRQATV